MRWTDTPRPRVTNPTISSGGTGEQHREIRIMMSSRPSTCTPADTAARRFEPTRLLTVVGSLGRPFSGASSPRISRAKRSATVRAATCPSPIAAKSRSSEE